MIIGMSCPHQSFCVCSLLVAVPEAKQMHKPRVCLGVCGGVVCCGVNLQPYKFRNVFSC